LGSAHGVRKKKEKRKKKKEKAAASQLPNSCFAASEQHTTSDYKCFIKIDMN
jgi:hypothetical protein